jgi:hypothetical protein
MANVYPAIRSHSVPVFRSQQANTGFTQHSPLTHTRSQSNPFPTLAAQNPISGLPPPPPLAERFPCDICNATFSRFVFRVDLFCAALTTKSSFYHADHTIGNAIMKLYTTLCRPYINAVTAGMNLAGQAQLSP